MLFNEYNRFLVFKITTFFPKNIMMEISRVEEDKNIEENIIKDVRNLFTLKKLKQKTNGGAIKGIRNLKGIRR